MYSMTHSYYICKQTDMFTLITTESVYIHICYTNKNDCVYMYMCKHNYCVYVTCVNKMMMLIFTCVHAIK